MATDVVCPWSFLDFETPKPASNINTNCLNFAQALKIHNKKETLYECMPQPCFKGESISIKITEKEYAKGVENCKFNLHGRLILKKGEIAPSCRELYSILSNLWKSISAWRMISLGKGYFEFEFSSSEDLRHIWSAGALNIKPGVLRFSQWTQDFNPGIQKQSNAQVWVRFCDLPQEYWRHRTLFEIACAIGTPISLDEPTKNHVFGHYARILIDVDLDNLLHESILVEREGFAFYVGVIYEKMPSYCTNCQIVGHHISNCNKLIPMKFSEAPKKNKEQNDNRQQTQQKTWRSIPAPSKVVNNNEIVVAEKVLEKENTTNSVVGYNHTMVEDPLINDIFRAKDFITNERAILIHEQDIFSAQVIPEQPVHVDDSSLAEKQKEDHQSSKFLDMRIVGPWSDAITDLDYDNSTWSGMNSSNVIISDAILNPNVSHDLEILRQHVWKENDAFKDKTYTDEEETEAALNFLKNRYVPPEEPFTEVVSKAKKKNMQKGMHLHNTRSRGRFP
ncbi:hypothetical protein QL285_039734 [Trifolium repens]|nr:hypothetical protein QL285_039734 [Trifolium repens]